MSHRNMNEIKKKVTRGCNGFSIIYFNFMPVMYFVHLFIFTTFFNLKSYSILQTNPHMFAHLLNLHNGSANKTKSGPCILYVWLTKSFFFTLRKRQRQLRSYNIVFSRDCQPHLPFVFCFCFLAKQNSHASSLFLPVLWLLPSKSQRSRDSISFVLSKSAWTCDCGTCVVSLFIYL